MYFFHFAYVETALVESVALSSNLPVAAIGDNRPAAEDTAPAVSGQIFWNDFDSVEGNSYVYDARKIGLITNTNATDGVIVTVKAKDDTINGLTRTVADKTINVAAGELALIPMLPSIFNQNNKVLLSIAEDGGTAIADTRIAILKVT